MQNTPLRVLEIVTVPLSMNGLALYPVRTAERMDARVQVDFLAGSASPDLKARIEKTGSRLFIAPNRMRAPIQYMRFVSKIVRENGYEVVHVHGNSCTMAVDLLACKLGGARVRIAHSHNTSCRFQWANRLLRGLFQANCTHALACSEAAGRWLFRNRPFEVMQNAIDVQSFAPNAEVRAKVRSQYDSAKKILLHVGNFSPEKNPLFLIDLIARLDESFVLWMVGDGALRAETEKRAQEMHLASRIRFLGARNDVPDFMQGADALLLPSVYEGFPTVALEAQAAGLATLLSENIAREVAFCDAAAFLPLNLEAWTHALQALSTASRNSSAQAAAEALQKRGFDLNQSAKILEEHYLHWAGRIQEEMP